MSGKIRHIEMNQLWLQEKVANTYVEVINVKGTENPADNMTKYCEQRMMKIHLEKTGQERGGERHEFALECE